jgi:chemotaxis protein CheD
MSSRSSRSSTGVSGVSAGGERRVHVIQGEFHVTDDPGVVLTTILGSCVAACIRDPVASVGGMNRFLLPGHEAKSRDQEAERYGVHLMELLLNGLLKMGARHERLEAKLFGGARTVDGLSDIGARNASFAETFLRNEGINHIGGSLGGELGRRVQFWPVSGRARQAMISADKILPPPAFSLPPKPADAGDAEFF